MKHDVNWVRLLLGGLLSCVAGVDLAFAQQYNLKRFRIASGGGKSTNASYTVSGTIGQQDSGAPMKGGNYSLTGGFWSVIAVVQTPGAPLLSVQPASNNMVVISWPVSSRIFALQQNSALGTTNWVDMPAAPVVVNGQNQVIVLPSLGNSFYRLKSP